MLCQRCRSAMTFERFRNEAQGGSAWSYRGWRCIFCGNIVDPVILANRTLDPNRDIWVWPEPRSDSAGREAA